MTLFSATWDTEVKKLAKDCVKEPKFVKLLSLGENYDLSDEDKEYIEKVGNNYKDPYGMYVISDMIWAVEHALANAREEIAAIAIVRVYSAITEEEYLERVFNGEKTSEEWKRIEALANGLAKLISMI